MLIRNTVVNFTTTTQPPDVIWMQSGANALILLHTVMFAMFLLLSAHASKKLPLHFLFQILSNCDSNSIQDPQLQDWLSQS